MLYRLQTVKHDVLAMHDENSEAPAMYPAGEEWLGLDPEVRIKLLFPQICAELIGKLPIAEIDTVASFTHMKGRRIAPATVVIPLPDDFMRLAAIKMDDWGKAIEKLEDERSLRGRLAASLPQSLRRMASPSHPMAVLTRSSEGLEIICEGTSGQIQPEVALYVARPSWRTDNTITIPERIYAEAVVKTAGLC